MRLRPQRLSADQRLPRLQAREGAEAAHPATRAQKSLVIKLSLQVPGRFSSKITLDGTPHLRVSAKARADVDALSGSVTGLAGLQIETTATVCDAPDPGVTRENQDRRRQAQ
jgi:hypothetical protein